MGAVLSAALMLEDLGHVEAAEGLESAVTALIRAGETTVDLGGSLTTGEVGDRIARAVASGAPVAG